MGKIYKIYRESNYIRVIDTITNELFNGTVKDVFVDKSNVQKNIYRLFNVKDLAEDTLFSTPNILKSDGSPYSVSEWETFYTENTGNFNGGGTAPTINTAFVEKTYASTMSVVYDSTNPNFDITLTGNLDLTITGTSNGDSGMVNLYFSATETATLNGFTDLVITGAGEMIPVYFIHDSDGLKWYNDVTGGIVDTSLFAVKDGTILYHTAVATNVGTVTSSGNNWTGTGTAITNEMVGAKITVGGQTTTILTIDLGAQTFTTNDVITATDEPFEIRCIAYKVVSDGSFIMFDSLGERRFELQSDKNIWINNAILGTTGNVNINGYMLTMQGGAVTLNGEGEISSSYKTDRVIYTVSTLPTPSSSVRVYASVSDGLSPTYMATAVGGGTVNCSVYWNGTIWLYH